MDEYNDWFVIHKLPRTIESFNDISYQYQIIPELISNPKSYINNIIPINDKIFCELSEKIKNAYRSYGFEVIPLGTPGKISTPYLIIDSKNKSLVVKTSPLSYSTYSKYIEAKNRTDWSQNHKLEFSACIVDKDISKLKYVVSDEFTNETIIAFILNYIQNKYDLPKLYVIHYKAGICDNIGLNIMENCDLGPLDRISDQVPFQKYINTSMLLDDNTNINLVDNDIVFQILLQCTVGLYMLESLIDFTSGDLKAGNIFLSSQPISEIYSGINIKSNFTCKIADFGKSSCTLGDVRFYTESKLANTYLLISPFTPKIISDNHEYYYIVDQVSNAQIFALSRHNQIPYYKSFDYYTLIVSVLTDPAFYYTFFTNDYLLNVFYNDIWDSAETAELMRNKIFYYVRNRRYDPNSGKSINDALNMLRGIKLKCSAVADIITSLRELQ